MFKEILNLVKTPISAGKKIAEKEKLGAIFIKLAIVCGVVAILALVEALILNGQLSSIPYMGVNVGAGTIIGVFFISFILMGGSVALVATGAFLASKIVKSPIKFVPAFSVATNYTIWLLPVFFLGFLFSFLPSFTVTNIILVIGLIYYLAGTIGVFSSMIKIDGETKKFWFTIATIAVIFVCIVVICALGKVILNIAKPASDMSTVGIGGNLDLLLNSKPIVNSYKAALSSVNSLYSSLY